MCGIIGQDNAMTFKFIVYFIPVQDIGATMGTRIPIPPGCKPPKNVPKSKTYKIL
jgi:hypothetical protein